MNVINKYCFPAETTKWCVILYHVNCFLIHYQGGGIEECSTKNVLKARLFRSNAEAVDYFTLFYNSESNLHPSHAGQLEVFVSVCLCW